jgi:hypothetical protein
MLVPHIFLGGYERAALLLAPVFARVLNFNPSTAMTAGQMKYSGAGAEYVIIRVLAQRKCLVRCGLGLKVVGFGYKGALGEGCKRVLLDLDTCGALGRRTELHIKCCGN